MLLFNLKVTTIALSCIRTIDAEHMAYLLRFLLLSATSVNVRVIIMHIREQLKFLGVSHAPSSQHTKGKGKAHVDNTEASVLDALRSSLRFKNVSPCFSCFVLIISHFLILCSFLCPLSSLDTMSRDLKRAEPP